MACRILCSMVSDLVTNEEPNGLNWGKSFVIAIVLPATCRSHSSICCTIFPFISIFFPFYIRCTHCMNFAPTYSEIARHFHSNPKYNVRVGKVDTTVQKALGQRFEVHAFPSFFVISGSSVYEFDEARTKPSLIKFATTDYKEQMVSLRRDPSIY